MIEINAASLIRCEVGPIASFDFDPLPPYPTRTKFDLRCRFLFPSLSFASVNEEGDDDETNSDSEASDETGICISIGTCIADSGVVTVVGLDDNFICFVILRIVSKSSS